MPAECTSGGMDGKIGFVADLVVVAATVELGVPTATVDETAADDVASTVADDDNMKADGCRRMACPLLEGAGRISATL